MKQNLDVHVFQDVVVIKRLNENRRVATDDVMMISAAAAELGVPDSTVSRWLGKELPLVTVEGSKKRLTLRSAVMAKKRLLDTARRGSLSLLSPQPPAVKTPPALELATINQ